MKKIYSLLLITISSLSFGQVFYSENIGTATGTLSIAANVFQNSTPIVYTGTADTRSTLNTGAYVGASQGRNVFITNTAGLYFQIDGLNSSAYLASDIQLSFGLNTSNAANLPTVEYSTNGGTLWTPITYTATGTGWTLVTIPGGQIPSSATLSLKFTQPTPALGQFRIDDVKLSNVSASCTLALLAPVAVCDASTIALDTYTVTIPYTGGANATYVVTPTSGTVGGDNPTSVAAGNIIISGITEGTAYSITVTGGTCNLSTNGNSPECKPTNTLPYNEPFDYTIGNSLGAEQKWTNAFSGDNVLVVTGNLNYTGITSTGNSISFSGAGIDVRTPFTTTNSGTIYASFLATASDLSNVTVDLTNTYFAFFTDAAGANTNARIWIRKNGTQYQYGLGTAAAPTNWSANLYNANETQYLVLGYDFTTNLLSLYENPTIAGSSSSTVSVTPAAAFTAFGGFMFRQDSATTTPTMIIDELTINTTPTFTLSSSSFSQIDGLKMYPNPTKNNLYIQTALNSDINVSIVNMLGKEVVNTKVVNNSVNVGNLTSGIYIVKITEEGKISTKKLIIE
jgi:hypothetical protein